MECRLGTTKGGGRVEAGVGATAGKNLDVVEVVAVNLTGAMLGTALFTVIVVTNDKRT
jgi:hypothetical protein